MARLVAETLRLGRSALIQVGAGCGYQGGILEYLAPALMWPDPVIMVATVLLRVEIPPLQQWLKQTRGFGLNRWPNADFRDCYSPEAWLAMLENRVEFQAFLHRWCG